MPVNEKKLEELRCEFEAILTVLTARIASAQDFEDWTTLVIQSRDLFSLAQRGRKEAAKL